MAKDLGGQIMKIFRIGFYSLVLAATLVIGLTTTAAARYLLTLLPTHAKTQDTPVQSLPNIEAVAEGQIMIPDTLVESADVEILNTEEFDPSGEYYLDPEKVPKTFSNIDHLYLQVREEYDENGQFVDRPIVPKGLIRTTHDFAFTRIAVGAHKISFQTATIDGISYKFTGQFNSPAEAYCETGEDIPELEGRLIKIKDGKWAAEFNAQFYISCGC